MSDTPIIDALAEDMHAAGLPAKARFQTMLRAAPAVCMVDGAGRPFLCRETRYVEPILEGGSLDEAIDAAMQEQEP